MFTDFTLSSNSPRPFVILPAYLFINPSKHRHTVPPTTPSIRPFCHPFVCRSSHHPRSRLTINSQLYEFCSGRQPRDGGDALESLPVVGRQRYEVVRPAVASVRDLPQPPATRQRRAVREQEVGSYVTTADVDLEVRRWVAAERRAA